MISIERIGEISSKLTIGGWFAGLGWIGFSGSVQGLSWIDWAILIVGGMFAVSIVIGGGLHLIAAATTRLLTGSSSGSPHAYSWAALIGPVIAFFTAGPLARVLA